MAVNLKDLARMNEFSLELKLLGMVRCLSLKTSQLSEANKKLNSPGLHSLDLVRWLLGEVARWPIEGQIDKDDPTEWPSLAPDELSSVADEDLEKFAEKLIQNNKYLLKTHKGKDIERAIDESACDFLARSFRHYATEEKSRWVRVTKPEHSSLFASTAMEAMQRDLAPLAQLQETIDKYAYSHSAVEQMLAEDKNKWARMNQSVFNSVSSSTTIADMQRNLAQQPALSSIEEAKQYLIENSASTTSTMELGLIRAATSQAQYAHYLNQDSISARLAKEIYRNEDIAREAARGLNQWNAIPTAISTWQEIQQQEARNLLRSHEAMFRLPLASEATRLLASYQAGAVAKFTQQYAQDILDRQRFIGAITNPWINRIEETRSVAAILELQSMGNALRSTHGFDIGLTAALRFDLGDWRDKITFPESVLIDPVARTDFYASRGFNTALTDFPEAAFHQSLGLAGFDDETINLELYGSAVRPSGDRQEEAGLQRTNKCHDWLQRFERRLRQFINDAMTAQYGPNWPRKRLAPKLYEYWEEKKRRAESSGEILAHIDVADFTDYETIICKQDHWREVFEIRFKKKESVRESLQRLQPIRLDAMHARIVTKEDELYLIAEIVRLLSAIK